MPSASAAPTIQSPSPGVCFWRVEWPTAGLYANPWDKDSVMTLNARDVYEGDCESVTGKVRGSSGDTGEYVHLAADDRIPGGYVRKNAVVRNNGKA